MAADAFSWLHLTDLHFGLRGQRHLWPNLRAPFFDDLAALHDRCGPWDAVFFTGDLTQQGKSDEFRAMQAEVLGPLWEKLAALGSGDAALCAVPGNHDLFRPNPKEPAARLLIKSFDEIADEFWDDPTGPYRKVVSNAFAAYAEWWQGAPHRPASLAPGLLPGDFAATLDRRGRKIGVVGLNTAALQLTGGDYTGRLTWDARQLDAVCAGAADHWTAAHDLCLLLTHHGPDWLTPAARKHGDTEC